MNTAPSSIVNFLLFSMALHGAIAFFHFFENKVNPEESPLSFSLVFSEIVQNPQEKLKLEPLPDTPKMPDSVPQEKPVIKQKIEKSTPAKAMLKPQIAAKEVDPDRAEYERQRGQVSARVALQDNAALLTYEQAILALLERNKRYPARALRRALEGEVRLFLEIDRNGRVLSSSITKSSGSALLDEEVHAMVKRASPFPQMPSHYSKPSAQFSIPVEFVIK
jgi:protein TonB